MARDTEHWEQVAIFGWAALQLKRYPELALMHAIPNGNYTSGRQGAYMKAEGLKKGVPDIFLPVPKLIFHGLYIELKTKENKVLRVAKGALKPHQKDFLWALHGQGYKIEVCYGQDEAKEAIQKYLNL